MDADPSIKLIMLCSPGNPTGTLIPLAVLRELLDYDKFKGVVVVDEAYIDFAGEGSAIPLLHEYANLCVLQTLSKSFGLAAIRFVKDPDSASINTYHKTYHLTDWAWPSPTPLSSKY